MPNTHCIRRIAALLLAISAAFQGCGDPEPQLSGIPVDHSIPAATFAGSPACGECHQEEYRRWTGSHHQLAMQVASDGTVLADFDNGKFDYFGRITKFTRQSDDYLVNTEGADGELQDFRVAYTFGVSPLQQFLVEFPGGRLQALTTAWDSRPQAEGGQRWFHLYPEEYVGPGDSLHWTGLQQNWNYMCAECHSTDLQRNYELGADRFDSRWSEASVGCEACHGPGSTHIARVRSGRLQPDSGLAVTLDDSGGAVWRMNPETGIAERSVLPMKPASQPEACGRCHARRAPLAAHYEYGRPLLDTHLPALLDENLYYADGQIQDEVYEYGSFLQSRMYQAGVTCTDCHEPHSAVLKAAGAASSVCATCHLPARFATDDHQRHAADVIECVDCHMPARVYMGVDDRRDHSFRIPRPDLSIATGVPNACNDCHSDRDAAWAEAAVREWYGSDRRPHSAEAIHAGRARQPGANRLLLEVIDDSAMPGIARATSLTLLAAPFDEDTMQGIRSSLAAADGLLRLAALRSLEQVAPESRAALAGPLLADPLLAVRFQALNSLSTLRGILPQHQQELLRKVAREYIASQLAIADRPEALANLANLARDSGDLDKADDYYGLAISRDPRGVVARVNLADSYARQERHEEAEKLLRDGLAANDNAALHHALGLALARTQQYDPALSELETAASLDPANSRYAFVYAVALNSLGRAEEALAVLHTARERFPADFDIGATIVTLLRDLGRTEEARLEARELLRRFPQDPGATALLQSLGGG
ncbi:MAG: tetratricopeptide repeat protein [Woeseiaceae bacterium]|nr:tetratricopeptide repeat protein [Woeseiaceae bacterium]